MQETPALVAEMWKPIEAAMRGFETEIDVDGVKFSVTWRIAADYKAAATLYGLKGQSSLYPCLWCFMLRRNHCCKECEVQRVIADMQQRVDSHLAWGRQEPSSAGPSVAGFQADVGDDTPRDQGALECQQRAQVPAAVH